MKTSKANWGPRLSRTQVWVGTVRLTSPWLCNLCHRVFQAETVLQLFGHSDSPYDARFLFKVWATGQWKIGECVIVFQFSLYMLSLSFLVSVLLFSNQNPCITNPIAYISPMTDKKPHVI